jgi:hypothetical protein
MKLVAGIFDSTSSVQRAIERLRAEGVDDRQISILTPGTQHEEIHAAVPTTDTEQPGTGKAIGAAVGGALGVAGGLNLGAAIASVLVPGVGPVLAAGLVGAALLGAGGVATGMVAGEKLEESLAPGLSHDEVFVYEDALRNGRTVFVVTAEDDDRASRIREILEDSGAESVDAARESWWVGLRDAEEASYTELGRDFQSEEPTYRKGFEAALHPAARGVSYEKDRRRLRECYGEQCEEECFRTGYERGQRYQQSLVEKYKS